MSERLVLAYEVLLTQGIVKMHKAHLLKQEIKKVVNTRKMMNSFLRIIVRYICFIMFHVDRMLSLP